MDLRLHSLTIGLLAVVLSTEPVSAQGAKGRPIEYANPSFTSDDTDSNLLKPGQSRLGQLESDLSRQFKGLTPGSSLDGLIMPAPLPVPPPSVPSAHSAEALKRQDWIYLTPEELMEIRSTQDKFKEPELTADGRDRNSLRPMERAYMDAMNLARESGVTNQMYGPSGAQTGLGLPGLVRESGFGAAPFTGIPGTGESNWERAMRFGSSFGGSQSSSDATDFSKFNQSPFSSQPKFSESQLRRAEQFMEIHNFSGTPLQTAEPGSPQMFSSPYVNSSFFDTPKPTLPATSPSLGSSLSGVATPVPTISTPVFTPAAEPTRPTPPPSPFMNISRSGFQ